MAKILAVLIGLALAGVAQAQIKCWTGADGRRACGDVPPPGAIVRTVRQPPASSAAPPRAPAAARGAAKDAAKRPLTAAEREHEANVRQAKASREAAIKSRTCDRYRETLRALESGQPVQRTDWKGGRYMLDDAQRKPDAAKARQSVQKHCG